jgi:hypothetical protein
LDPPLAKKLAQLVAMEKNILRSMENVSKERMDNAVSSSFLYFAVSSDGSSATVILLGC